MSSHQRGAVALLAVLGLGSLMLLGTYEVGAYPGEGPDQSKRPAAEKPLSSRKLPPASRREEEKAIRKTAEALSTSFNKGELDALAASWTEDAEYTTEAGKTFRGRDAVRAMLKKALAETRGAKQSIQIRSIRFIKPDVASEDGTVSMTSEDGAVRAGRYVALWVKQGGRWMLSSVRDLPDRDDSDMPPAYSKLKPLAWMVGEWRDRDGRDSVHMSCKWGPNQTFLIQHFTVHRGSKDLSSMQRIGWDAHNQRVRSWVFDSTGGFGEGFWKRDGNTWDIQSEGVFPDGRVASSVNRWRYIDDRTAEWSSRDRQADETPLPDLKVTLVREDAKTETAPVRAQP